MKGKRKGSGFACAVFLITAAFAVAAQIPSPTTTPQLSDADRVRVERAYGEAKDLLDRATPASTRASIEKFLACTKLAKAAGAGYWETICFAGAAQAYENLGERSSAVGMYQGAFEAVPEDQPQLGAGLLRDFANLCNTIGEHGRALELLYYEIELRRLIKDVAGELDALHSIAIIYGDLGFLKEAVEVNLAVLKLQQQHGTKKETVAATLNNLAFAYYRLGRYSDASTYFRKAFDIAAALKRTDLQAPILVGMGDAALKLGRPDVAMAHYRMGITLSRKHGNRIFEAVALLGIGNVYRARKQPRRAIEPYNEALALVHAEEAREEESRSLASLMSLWRELGDRAVAILYGKKAINLNQATRENLKHLEKVTQQQYLKTKETAYRELADLLIADARLPEAQAVLDMLKEQEYEQFTKLRSGDSSDLVPYRNTETDALLRIDLLATLAARQRELVSMQTELGSAFPEDKRRELESVRNDIESANREFRVAIDTLATTESSVEDKLAEIKTEKNLQRAIDKLSRELNTGVVAIYTVIGTDDTKTAPNTLPRPKFGWAVLVTPESRKAYPIDVRGLETTVLDLRNALKSDKYDPKPLAQKLYDAIFRQRSPGQKSTLESDLAVIFQRNATKTIMWSLDGFLRYVPMAVLHDGKQYLVEKYRQTIFTKQSLLLLNDMDSPTWQALGLGVSEAKTIDKKNFDALDGAKRELEDIVRQQNETTGILNGTRVMNADFTKDRAVELWREGRYQAVHIASHFSFDPTEQSRSFLVVGDGKLTFADLQDKDNLFGSVDLLTLSACETAMNSNGKESEGFPFLAQSLGAKTVIASLWKVSDTGTPDLMIRFYKLRAQDPAMPKGEAFRRAQLALLSGEASSTAAGPAATKSGKRSDPLDLDGTRSRLPAFVKDPAKPFAHPHYWASFVLIGNWR